MWCSAVRESNRQNGHLGITVFGGVARERLQLSEHSIYRSGGTAARMLDLNTATATTTFKVGEVTYTHTAFCSYPDGVTVVKITASEKGRITFNARLSRPTDLYAGPWLSMVDRMIKEGASRYVDPVTPEVYDDSTIGFTGQAADDGTKFAALITVRDMAMWSGKTGNSPARLFAQKPRAPARFAMAKRWSRSG